MVNAHARRHADGHARLLRPLCDGADARHAVRAQSEAAVVRLAPRGEGGAASGRVGDAVAGTVGSGQSRIGETGKAEFADADAPFSGSEIRLRAVHLVQPHAVADEVEHIFRGLGSRGAERAGG